MLIEDDGPASEATLAFLRGCFGGRCIVERTAGRRDAANLLQGKSHDLYLLADPPGATDTAKVIRAAIAGGCTAPIIILAPNSTPDLDILEAGAADFIPKADLTPPALERSIRHALVREASITRSRAEIEGLTAEKSRLNMLRDANHRFVENACHDFRSPLTVIKEFASIIAEGLSGDVSEEQAEFLEIILTRVDQLSQMVDGILDASRLESDLIGVRREEHSVAQLVEKVRATLEQQAAAHKVDIKFEIPASLPNVLADAESIGRVIVNLGTNASKYAGEKGNIRVWARHEPENQQIVIGVTDSGPGIAPEHVKLIFERFQQVGDKPQEKSGFGLGLHIASELVRVNFGMLSVESEPNKGSTFAFTLPVFDVNLVIPLHFNFLKTSRHSFQQVSIAMATSTAEGAPAAEIERLLNRQLRSYDLLLRLNSGAWLICIASDNSETAKVVERIRSTYTEAARNRPDSALTELRFRSIGSWTLSNRPEGLRDAIRGAYAQPQEARAG